MSGSGMGLELHEACAMGDSDTLEEYLKTGKYDVDLKDPEYGNRAPIHWACGKGYVECLRLLLDYGAVGDACMDMGWTPAHCAAETGRITVLRALHAANLLTLHKDEYGDTPLQIAQTYGHTECVKYLQQVEAEMKEESQEGTEVKKDEP